MSKLSPAASSWGLLNSVFNTLYHIPSCAKTFDSPNFFVSSCIIIFRLVVGNCGKICGNLKDGIFPNWNDHPNVFLMIYHCLQFVNSYYLPSLTPHCIWKSAQRNISAGRSLNTAKRHRVMLRPAQFCLQTRLYQNNTWYSSRLAKALDYTG